MPGSEQKPLRIYTVLLAGDEFTVPAAEHNVDAESHLSLWDETGKVTAYFRAWDGFRVSDPE